MKASLLAIALLAVTPAYAQYGFEPPPPGGEGYEGYYPHPHYHRYHRYGYRHFHQCRYGQCYEGVYRRYYR